MTSTTASNVRVEICTTKRQCTVVQRLLSRRHKTHCNYLHQTAETTERSNAVSFQIDGDFFHVRVHQRFHELIQSFRRVHVHERHHIQRYKVRFIVPGQHPRLVHQVLDLEFVWIREGARAREHCKWLACVGLGSDLLSSMKSTTATKGKDASKQCSVRLVGNVPASCPQAPGMCSGVWGHVQLPVPLSCPQPLQDHPASRLLVAL